MQNIASTTDTKHPRAASAIVELPVAALIFIWVGAAISGNMIAAPAKFQAPSLTMPVALDVGRMQFQWIGLFEAVCLLALVALLVWNKCRPGFPLLAGIVVFGFQRLWIMPLLDARTLSIIAGHPVGESHLHLIYVAAEVLKIGCLIWAAVRSMTLICRKHQNGAASPKS